MVSIIGNACGGCYSQLPPQTVIEIKENNKIINCTNCSVLQFWDGAEE
jgi:predicted  nucleic acid-binding Zn-ribbon protein